MSISVAHRRKNNTSNALRVLPITLAAVDQF